MNMPRRKPLTATLGGIVSLAMLAFAPAQANAQSGRRVMFTEAFRPDIMQRDISLLVTSLQLEEWQRPIMEALLEDYMTSFNTGVEAMKDKMKTAAEAVTRSGSANADQVLARTMEPLNAWRQEKERLGDKFMSDVRSQLSPQQLESWPRFERALRRERMLPEGELAGESVDLLALVARMQPTPEEDEALRGSVAAFEISLDEALRARLDIARRLRPSMEDAMAARDSDRQADVQDQLMQGNVAVRSANDAGIDSIAGAFGPRGAEFRQLALETAYPEVFRPHPVMLLMQRARKLPSLTEEQGGQVDALMAEFGAAVAEADMRLLAVVRDDEPKAPRRRLKAAAERRAAGAAGSAPPRPADPVAEARSVRDQMGEPYRDRLIAILNPEQQRDLPGLQRPSSEQRAPDAPSPGPSSARDGKRSLDEPVKPDEETSVSIQRSREGGASSKGKRGRSEGKGPKEEPASAP